MKKLFFFLAALLISTAMTSCLSNNSDSDDSNYHTVTAAEKSAIIQKIRQSYSGCLLFVNDSSKSDSLPSTLAFTSDTTAVMNYPVSALANFLTYSGTDSARIDLRKAPNQNIECLVYTPSYVLTDYWNSYYVKGQYRNLTFAPKSQTLKFTSGTHTYEVTFSYTYITYQYNYFYPYFHYINDTAYAFVLIQSIKVNNGATYSIYTPTEFEGKVK